MDHDEKILQATGLTPAQHEEHCEAFDAFLHDTGQLEPLDAREITDFADQHESEDLLHDGEGW